MPEILLDSGPVISLTTNNLLWLLGRMPNASWSIVSSVKRELVDRPLATKKFKFEALQVERLIESGTIKVIDDPKVKASALRLMDLTNNLFSAHGQPIRIVQLGEIETIAAALHLGSNRIVVDERIVRSLLEDAEGLHRAMERRLHTRLNVDSRRLGEFRALTRHVRLIRSAELVSIAYEKGLLDQFLVRVQRPQKELLESVLWAVKLSGCSISEDEISEVVRIELGR